MRILLERDVVETRDLIIDPTRFPLAQPGVGVECVDDQQYIRRSGQVIAIGIWVDVPVLTHGSWVREMAILIHNPWPSSNRRSRH